MTFDIGLHEVCVRTGVRYVITKFSGMDSLPNFLTHGTPLRARELRYKCKNLNGLNDFDPFFSIEVFCSNSRGGRLNQFYQRRGEHLL